MGSEDQIHEPVTLLELVHYRCFLHHTAAEGNLHVRIFFLIAMQHSQTSIHTQVGIFTNCTGIVDDKICLFILCLHITDFP